MGSFACTCMKLRSMPPVCAIPAQDERKGGELRPGPGPGKARDSRDLAVFGALPFARFGCITRLAPRVCVIRLDKHSTEDECAGLGGWEQLKKDVSAVGFYVF